MKLEICLDNLESVKICAVGGVDRIELCAGLVEGGTTPSLAFLRAARRVFPGAIMAMLRPRSGDFLYSDDEFALMLDEMELFRREGADGVVFGMLTADGLIDAARSRELVSRAAGLDLTFHRAFDVTRDPAEALETLVSLGVPRVLTSGGAPNVWEGLENLAALNHQAAGRITILPGGGVSADRIEELARATGVTEVHLSARASVSSPMLHRRPDIPMGASAVPGEYERKHTSPELLRRARAGLLSAAKPCS